MFQLSTASATPAQRKRAGALVASLRGAALATVLLFSAGAQADPAVAEQILQTIRTERQIFDVHMQQANWYLDVNPSQAQFALLIAQADATTIGARLANLRQQNLDSRANGQYNDLQALERAIQHGDAARQRIQLVKTYLLTLQMETPPSVFTRQLLNTQIMLFNMSMQELERAMDEA